jgi:pimeloyl-ACP methyl ester carboxylesterase
MPYDSFRLSAGGILRRDADHQGDTLIVLVHGFRKNSLQWESLLAVAGHDPDFQGCDLLVFKYSTGIRSRERLQTLGQVLSDSVELHHGGYKHIVLIGYSLGGLIVRSALLHALGVSGARQKRVWPAFARRIVLMATPNRGLGGPGTAFRERLELAVTRWFSGPMLRDAQKGSDFITRLRLEWVYAFRDHNLPTPQVVQLLGANDQYVSATDSNDVTSFKDGKLFMIGGVRHQQLATFTDVTDEKYVLLKRSALEPFDDVRGDEEPVDESKLPSAVLFELHGIRDYGGWLDKVAETARGIDKGIRIEKPGYGYFSVIDFIVPWRRRRRIAWFCDRYTERVAAMAATDLDIPFLVIGHSYGTYLIAECLRRFPQMRFRRACFVGSVVPENFPPWRAIFGANKQLEALRNDCATHDWPVAICCRILNQMGFKDIGRGGFVGFRIGLDEAVDHLYVPGNHSATLTSEEGRRSAVQYLLGHPTDWPQTVNAPRWLLLASQWAFPLVVLGVFLAAFYGVPALDRAAHWINVAPHFIIGGLIVLFLVFLIYI